MEKLNRWAKRIWKYIVKPILICIIVMGPALFFGYNGNSMAMGFSIVSGSLVIVFCNMDKFEFIKGAGFEAKLKAVNEAYAKLESVKEISAILLSFSIDVNTYNNRLCGIPEDCKKKYLQEVNELINQLNLKNDYMIKEAVKRAEFLKAIDLFGKFVEVFDRISPDAYTESLMKLKTSAFTDKQLPTKEKVIEITGHCSTYMDLSIKSDFPAGLSTEIQKAWYDYTNAKERYEH